MMEPKKANRDMLSDLDDLIRKFDRNVFQARDFEEEKYWTEKKLEVMRMKADFIHGYPLSNQNQL